MTEPRTPWDQALDLMLFGPLGLAITAGEELPRMIEKGRSRVGSQITVARMIGEMAVKQGQHMASSAFRQSTETLVGLGIIPAPPSQVRGQAGAHRSGGGTAVPGPAPAPSALVSTNGRTIDGSPRLVDEPDAAEAAGPGPGSAPPVSASPVSAELGIPGYDSLSASQVVQRLAGLAPDELEAVRRYEAAGRGRRTILNKIVQLQTGRS
jgi:hypothetical protein